MRSTLVASWVCAALACGPDGGIPEPGDPDAEHEVVRQIGPIEQVPTVDILIVVDDSSSMFEEQRLVGGSFAPLIDVLEDPDVGASYRIAVTTTDVGNPLCEGATAERGAFVTSSCKARLGDFLAEDGRDVGAAGCIEHCSADAIEILPTTTTFDAVPAVRPWIEGIDCTTNVAGVSAASAFACIGPQGVSGCGFESPLEAMYQALVRTMTPGDPQFGFLREHATLLVLLLTDGTDCSYRDERIFLPAEEGGTPVFWSDPGAAAPTRAACWNAGVRCEGDGEPYDACLPTNASIDGALDVSDEDAVLYPVSRYVELLRQIERSKLHVADDPRVVVSLVSGVPAHYDGGLLYYRALDPVEQAEFGIGAGCTYGFGDPAVPLALAQPPVRERAVAEAFARDEQPIHSICQEDYRQTLGPILPIIRDVARFACMPACVADASPAVPGVQPRCTLREQTPSPETGEAVVHDIAPCVDGDQLPAGADVCFVALVGDATSDFCAERGWNLEFRLVRRDGTCRHDGAQVFATCTASADPSVDCPNLP